MNGASGDRPHDLYELTLTRLSAALATGAVSSVEATTHALERIYTLDGSGGLNAFITVTADRALAQAQAADTRQASGDRLGPLDGVPIALKDLFDTAGVLTTAASRVFADRVPDTDATVVRRLHAAGAVILGKTNMLEFAYGYPHPDFGETVNPWDRTRTAGGSSGGSAAAVAAGLAWGALGSDTGGSIRSPAAYCGITGLKPTVGLISLAGVVSLSWSLDHAGPMARTAADCALLLAAIAGHDPADPVSAPRRDTERVLAELSEIGNHAPTVPAAAPSLAGLRIGVIPRLFDLAVTPGLRTVVERAVAVLAGLGAEIVEVALPPGIFERAVPAVTRIYAVEAAAYHRQWLQQRSDGYGPVMREGLEAALTLHAVHYADSLYDRLRVRAAFDALYERFDLLAWPAQPIVAPPLGTTADAIAGPDAEDAPTIEVEIGATGPANLTGEPSISVPCGFAAGLPVGLLLQAPRFADARLLRAAIAHQTATGAPPLADVSQRQQ